MQEPEKNPTMTGSKGLLRDTKASISLPCKNRFSAYFKHISNGDRLTKLVKFLPKMPQQSRSVLCDFDKLGTIVFPFHTYQQLAACALDLQNCKGKFDSGLKMCDLQYP